MRWRLSWMLASAAVVGCGSSEEPATCSPSLCQPECCEAGRCEPRVLAEHDSTIGDIDADGSGVYWRASSSIFGLRSPTGVPVELYQHEQLTRIFAWNGHVYGSHLEPPTVFRVPIDGSSEAEALRIGPPLHWVDADGLYFEEAGLARLPHGAKSPIALTSTSGSALTASNAERVFWMAAAECGADIVSVAKSGGEVTLHVDGAAACDAWPFQIALAGGYLFYDLVDPSGPIVFRQPIDGGEPRETVVPGFLVGADETSIFHVPSWPSVEDPQQLRRQDHSGGAPVVVADGVAGDIAFDDSCVYWSDGERVMTATR